MVPKTTLATGACIEYSEVKIGLHDGIRTHLCKSATVPAFAGRSDYVEFCDHKMEQTGLEPATSADDACRKRALGSKLLNPPGEHCSLPGRLRLHPQPRIYVLLGNATTQLFTLSSTTRASLARTAMNVFIFIGASSILELLPHFVIKLFFRSIVCSNSVAVSAYNFTFCYFFFDFTWTSRLAQARY